MIQNIKTQNTFIIALILFGSINPYKAYASKIRVINEKENDITIKIIPEGSSNQKPTFSQVISGTINPGQKHFADFHITPSQTYGKSHFAVAGSGGFFLGDKCRNLSILKNYEISFQDSTLGTTCIAEEIPESLFNFSNGK